MHEDFIELVNPKILRSKEIVTCSEKCISFPFLEFNIDRFKQIKIQYKTLESLDKRKEMILEG